LVSNCNFGKQEWTVYIYISRLARAVWHILSRVGGHGTGCVGYKKPLARDGVKRVSVRRNSAPFTDAKKHVPGMS
jgi:hypothetical protein